MTKYNIWFFGSLIVAAVVAMPIITVFFSFFNETSNYFYILKETFLLDYIFNSITILLFVILFTKLLSLTNLERFICIFGFNCSWIGLISSNKILELVFSTDLSLWPQLDNKSKKTKYNTILLTETRS